MYWFVIHPFCTPVWTDPFFPFTLSESHWNTHCSFCSPNEGLRVDYEEEPKAWKGLGTLIRPPLTAILPPNLTLWCVLLSLGTCSSSYLQWQWLFSFMHVSSNLLHLPRPVKISLSHSPEPGEISACVPMGPCACAHLLVHLILKPWCCLVPLAGGSPRKRAVYLSLTCKTHMDWILLSSLPVTPNIRPSARFTIRLILGLKLCYYVCEVLLGKPKVKLSFLSSNVTLGEVQEKSLFE